MLGMLKAEVYSPLAVHLHLIVAMAIGSTLTACKITHNFTNYWKCCITMVGRLMSRIHWSLAKAPCKILFFVVDIMYMSDAMFFGRRAVAQAEC